MTAQGAASPNQPLFVLSTGRCGSTLLSEILGLHPSILSISELFSMLGGPRALARPSLTGREFWTLVRELDPDLRALLERARVPEAIGWSAEDSSSIAPLSLVTLPSLSLAPSVVLPLLQRALADGAEGPPVTHFDRLFAALAEQCGRRLLVERSGGSIEYGELIRAAWPDARLILLTRGGCDTAFSMATHPMFRVRLARILARNHDLSVAECLHTQIPTDRFGAYWSALMIKAQRILRSVPSERLLVLHYEQLVREPDAVLCPLARFVTGEPAPESWLAEARQRIRKVPSRWTSLPAGERAALEIACTPGERCFGTFDSSRERAPSPF